MPGSGTNYRRGPDSPPPDTPREAIISELTAGAARIDVTPGLGAHPCGCFRDRRAADILDPLRAKAITLANGETTLGFVICDLIVVPGEVADAAQAIIAERTRTAPMQSPPSSASHATAERSSAAKTV